MIGSTPPKLNNQLSWCYIKQTLRVSCNTAAHKITAHMLFKYHTPNRKCEVFCYLICIVAKLETQLVEARDELNRAV